MCPSSIYHQFDNSGATAKKLGLINTKLNLIDRYLFALEYVRDADPIGAKKTELNWYDQLVRPPTLVGPP